MAIDRRIDVFRQERHDAPDVIAHLLGGHVDVLVEREGDEDLRHALARGRAKLVDAADGVDGLLDLVGDFRFDFARRRAGQARHHDDGGKVDLGEPIDAELEVADGADDGDEEDEHRREDRALDADFGEPLHGSILRWQ